MKNTLKTFVLLAGLTALLMAIGNAVGGRNGLMIALVFAGTHELCWLLVQRQDCLVNEWGQASL